MNSFERGAIPSPEKWQPYKAAFDTPEKVERIKDRTQNLIDEIVATKPDVLFFIDRSARPLSYMLRDAWDESKYGALPKIKFLNIGREKGELLGWSEIPPSDEEAAKKYWDVLDSSDYVKKVIQDVRGDFKPTKDFIGRRKMGSLMIVDDFSESGFSVNLAEQFLTRHFPTTKVFSHLFFDRADEAIFHKDGWNGVWLPWHTDKSYTLLSEEDVPNQVTAKVESDPKKRANGVALREEIRGIFKK